MRILILSLFVILAVLPASTAAWNAEDVLTPDPTIRMGTLDNGLRYYIRANPRPENRVELRLVVDAGSMQEEDDQQGLAHFLEHMAFNGTENFAAGDLVDYLESIGARFGPDLNAYTSFDETVYMLQIPTDKEGLLEKGFLVLRDWAGRMTLDPAEIDKERGVVIEEWRRGQGASQRIRKVQWPVIFKDSRYAERLPIGKPEVLEGAPAERLAAFYSDWYRPDLMAVVVVGNVDVDATETTIREHFSSLENPAQPRERLDYGVPHHDDMLATVATDPEQPYTTVNVMFKHDRASEGTVGAYRNGLLAGLFSGMLNARLQELTETPDAPFRFAATGANSFVRGTDMFLAFAVTKEDEVELGLRGLLTEIARVRAHGFTPDEMERAKARVIASLEKTYNERDKSDSGGYASEYIRNFLQDEPIPGIAVEFELVQELLPSITLDELNDLVNKLIHEDNTVISVSAPEKDGLVLPSGSALLAAAAEAVASAPAAYKDAEVAAELMSKLPEPGTVRSRRELPDLGVTEVVFSNGVTAWLKPTDFKNDEILFSGIAVGGLSRVAKEKYRSASMFSSILGVTGYGGHTPTQLSKLLAGKIAGASVSLSDFSHGISGSARPEDLETALQLTHLVLTSPNRDPELFTVFQDQLRVFLANRDSRPETRYTDKLLEVNYQGHYMRTPLTLDVMDDVDLDTAFDVYQERMADASDVHYSFVGAIDVETTIPLLARYLGSLPSLEDGPSTIGDPGMTFPGGQIRETVRAGMEPKADTRITWPARASMDEMEMFRMRMATDILEIRLRELLREELGSTYSVGVGYRYTPPYTGYAATVVSFGSSPGNVGRMVDAVFSEVAKFKEEGPTQEEVAKVQELERRSVQTGLERNGYWLGSFVSLQLLGWDPNRVLHRLDRIDTLTPENLKADFGRYFPEDNNSVISLLPESGTGGDEPGSE